MKVSISVLAAIFAVATAANTGGPDEWETSISYTQPVRTGYPHRNWANRLKRGSDQDDLEADDVAYDSGISGSVNDNDIEEDYVDEAGNKWELKWEEKINQDRYDAIHDIIRTPPNVTDYSHMANDDPRTLEYWTDNNKRYVFDITLRLSYLLQDKGIDIHEAFCSGVSYEEVILKHNPQYILLVDSIAEFSEILYTLNVNLRDEMCGAVLNNKRDNISISGFQPPKLRNRKDVEEYLKFMDSILNNVGKFSDVDDEKN